MYMCGHVLYTHIKVIHANYEHFFLRQTIDIYKIKIKSPPSTTHFPLGLILIPRNSHSK